MSRAAIPYISSNSACVRGMWKSEVTTTIFRQPAGSAWMEREKKALPTWVGGGGGVVRALLGSIPFFHDHLQEGHPLRPLCPQIPLPPPLR